MSNRARRHEGTEARRGSVNLSRYHLVTTCILLIGLVNAVAAEPQPDARPAGLAFRVAKVVALDDRNTVINDAIVLVKDGRIEAVGPAAEIAVPEGYRVLNFRDEWLIPGIVEAHDHSAAGNWNDLNDMVYLTNPGLDSRPVPQPDCDWIKRARTGGVTTVMLIPGSGTNLAGFGTVVNTGGKDPDEIVMRSPGALKIAQAGNPEWYFGGNGRSFMNWNTRQTLGKAKAYAARWEEYENGTEARRHEGTKGGAGEQGGGGAETPRPEFDPIWDGFRGVFRGEYPATMHTQMYQVVLATLEMIDGEFKLWTVLNHSCFDAWKLGRLVQEAEAAGHPLWTICGPRGYHFDRTCRRMVGFTAGYWKHGVRRLAVNTDAPVIPQEELSYQAAMSCWFGWLPYPALRGLTNITAKSMGFYDRIGSVEPDKQADLSIWTGDPLDPRSACLMTVINGRIVYDGTQGLRRF